MFPRGPVAIVGTVLAFAGVVASFVLVLRTLAPADPARSLYQGVRDPLVATVEREGPEAALALLRQRIADPAVAGICHALVHEVGQAARAKLGTDEALRTDDDICGSGYTHGIIETSFAEMGDPAVASKTFCPPKQAKCFHGLGHGLMFALANDVPRSIALCDALAERSDRIQCAEGVFMENFNTDESVHRTAYLRTDDPFFPCRDQAEPYKGVCAFYAPRYYVRLHPQAYKEALAWCATLPKGPADGCAKGVGSVTAKQHINDPLLAQDVCEGGAADQVGYCVQGAVSYVIVHHASVAKGQEFCDALHDEHRAGCERVLQESEPFFGE